MPEPSQEAPSWADQHAVRAKAVWGLAPFGDQLGGRGTVRGTLLARTQVRLRASWRGGRSGSSLTEQVPLGLSV